MNNTLYGKNVPVLKTLPYHKKIPLIDELSLSLIHFWVNKIKQKYK